MSAPQILSPDGTPARRPSADVCPRCGAGRDKRAQSAGFGTPHLVCTYCGHDFPEGSE